MSALLFCWDLGGCVLVKDNIHTHKGQMFNREMDSAIMAEAFDYPQHSSDHADPIHCLERCLERQDCDRFDLRNKEFEGHNCRTGTVKSTKAGHGSFVTYKPVDNVKTPTTRTVHRKGSTDFSKIKWASREVIVNPQSPTTKVCPTTYPYGYDLARCCKVKPTLRSDGSYYCRESTGCAGCATNMEYLSKEGDFMAFSYP